MATSNMSYTRYIGVTETATLLRTALKDAFAGVTFRVTSKSYSRGASIRVSWLDGPTTEQVQATTRAFESTSFDPMTDLMSYHTGTLDGETVFFGADYIFPNRQYTDAGQAQLIAACRARNPHFDPRSWAGQDDGLALFCAIAQETALPVAPRGAAPAQYP